jgi:dienelactone hydrolase
MTATKIGVKTRDGLVDSHLFQPLGNDPHPAVIFYMDGLGLRQALFDMAERLTINGYAVLLPNLYYRHGPSAPIDMMKDRDRMLDQTTFRDSVSFSYYPSLRLFTARAAANPLRGPSR